MHADLSILLSVLCQSSVHPTTLGITSLKLEWRKTGYTDTIRRDSTYSFLKRPFFRGGTCVLLDNQALFTVKLPE